jgi:predicted permease
MRIFRRKHFESDMDAEFQAHLEAYADDLVGRGLDRAEALRRAQLEFGGVSLMKEDCRQACGLRALDEWSADVRLTLRRLRRNPGFAAVAILSLALGIGANTAIFGLLDAVMLRMLPVRDPASLVFVRTAGTLGRDGPPYPYFELLRDHARTFEAVGVYAASDIEVGIGGGRELKRGVFVSPGFYEMLGVSPLMGRTPSNGDVAVIGRNYWKERFGSDPAILGRTIRLFDRSVTIVGVLPSEILSLEPGRPIDIAVPMDLSDPTRRHDRTALWIQLVARLKPGVREQQVSADANGLFSEYMSNVALPGNTRARLYDHIDLTPAGRGLGGLRSVFLQPLTALMILAGLVLVAACVNVSNLLLARAAASQKDYAVRLALGAGRGRLIRQGLAEALVLVGSGAAVGIWFARLGQSALAAFFAGGPNPVVLDLPLNAHMMLFTVSVAVASGVAFGILPALRASRSDPAAGLQSGSRSVAGSRFSPRLGRAMVVAQVALSMVLLAGAGLFIRTVQELEAVDLGFPREGILAMEMSPERQALGSPPWLAAEAEMLDRIRRIPGVRSASWATMNPMGGRDRGATLEIPGFTPRAPRDNDIHMAVVSPAYFETFGVPLLLGRAFTKRDGATAQKVAIINETAAHFYFGDTMPLGRRVRFANYPAPDAIYEIVGVVKDFLHDSLREQVSRFIFLPIPQSVERINRLSLAVHCSGDAAGYAAPVRRELQRVRPALVLTNVATVEQHVEDSLRRERLISALATAFGALALALACIGIYGTISYAVTRRTSEIGIRMALGATSGSMIWLVLREAVMLTSAGALLGIPAIVAVARLSRALLYGLSAFDLPGLAGALAVMLVAAAVAGFVPARRAGRLDPMSVLRCE